MLEKIETKQPSTTVLKLELRPSFGESQLCISEATAILLLVCPAEVPECSLIQFPGTCCCC